MSDLLDETRLRWIETWAKGWRRSLEADPARAGFYRDLPLDVAVSMIEEATAALRDPHRAIDLLARHLHESGQEIGEAVERRRDVIEGRVAA